MPKTSKAGGNARRKQQASAVQRQRELVFAEPQQGYGVVVAICGSKRFRVRDTLGVERVAHARGSIKRGERICMGDLVLFSERDFQRDKIDILQRYTPEEARKLHGCDEVSAAMVIRRDTTATAESDDDDICFDDDAPFDAAEIDQL